MCFNYIWLEVKSGCIKKEDDMGGEGAPSNHNSPNQGAFLTMILEQQSTLIWKT